MSTPGPRSKARLIAAGYVALVTLAALAHEIAGRPESGEAAMLLAAWPGDTLLLVLVLYPLALLAGDAPATEEAGPSLSARRSTAPERWSTCSSRGASSPSYATSRPSASAAAAVDRPRPQ